MELIKLQAPIVNSHASPAESQQVHNLPKLKEHGSCSLTISGDGVTRDTLPKRIQRYSCKARCTVTDDIDIVKGCKRDGIVSRDGFHEFKVICFHVLRCRGTGPFIVYFCLCPPSSSCSVAPEDGRDSLYVDDSSGKGRCEVPQKFQRNFCHRWSCTRGPEE